MNRRSDKLLVGIGLAAAGALSAAGLVGLVTVLRMGLAPAGGTMGHSADYVRGWSFFFLIMLGIPCLAAFVGGLIPWGIWLRKRLGGDS